MGDAFNDVGNIGKDPLFLRRLDHFISDLLLARSHLEQGLDTELGEAAERLQVFLKTAEKTLPKAARDKAERCKDFSLTDACANPGVLPSHKRLAYRSHPIDFFTIMSKILPAISALPRIVATIPDAPAVNADDPALPLDDPLVVTVGEVLHLASDGGPYYVLVTDLVDPQSFEATFAVAYGVRMWTAPDIAALGAPAPLGFEGHLGEGEVALSKFKELVRPSTILGRMRLVPGWWSDPVDAGSCLCYNIFFDYRRLTLSPIDFRLQSEPWRVLHWLRCRAVSYNDNSRRTWDFVVDRMYHAFYDHFLSFKPSVTKENKLINLNIVVERDWLLQAPLSVLKTAKFSEGDESGTLAVSFFLFLFQLIFIRLGFSSQASGIFPFLYMRATNLTLD